MSAQADSKNNVTVLVVMRRNVISVSLILIACAGTGFAQTDAADEPGANPGRPTISTPATLTPVGYFQFETGVLGATQSPEFSQRVGFNEVTKFSVAPRFELIASGEPIAHFTSGGLAANKIADAFLGAQAMLYRGEGAKPTIAASYFHRVYDGGAPELDYGSPTNSFLLLASADVLGFHYDANAFITELVQEPIRRAQYAQTLSISHPLPARFGISGEIWHFTQPFLRSNAVGNLWAIGYAARKTLVLDAGFNRGLTGTSTQWEAFVGFTYLLPHKIF